MQRISFIFQNIYKVQYLLPSLSLFLAGASYKVGESGTCNSSVVAGNIVEEIVPAVFTNTKFLLKELSKACRESSISVVINVANRLDLSDETRLEGATKYHLRDLNP